MRSVFYFPTENIEKYHEFHMFLQTRAVATSVIAIYTHRRRVMDVIRILKPNLFSVTWERLNFLFWMFYERHDLYNAPETREAQAARTPDQSKRNISMKEGWKTG
jgi:hypothetical protein